jgi:C-terminal processing protease CtpA/Prc
MRRHILTTIALLPLLLNLSQAGQIWMSDSSPFGDSGTSSYLGVDIADITTDRLGALKLKEEQGVEVTMVDQDAPAGKAGIKEHDVILTMNGTAIESKTQLQRMIHETPPGRVVTLGLSRDGQAMTIKVQLADRRNEFALKGMKDGDWDKNFHIEIPPISLPDIDVPNMGVVYVHSSMRSGLMVENLTPQLGEFFGAKNGNGVLVRSVEKGSRAEKAGLHAGDVIIRVGVIRDKKEQTLTLTVPERKDSGEINEESLEEPELDADRQMELSELQTEIAKLRPQMDLAKEESRKASAEMLKSLCDERKQLQEQAEKLSQELRPKVQEELQKSLKKLEQQKEEIRLQLRRDGLDI